MNSYAKDSKKNAKIILATVAGFIAVNIFDMLFHGQLLAPYYEETKQLWRTKGDMDKHLPFGAFSTFITTLMLAIIFGMGYEAKGIKEGLRFGTLFGIIFAASSVGWYMYMPLTTEVIVGWVIGAFLTNIMLGIIFSLVYKALNTNK